MNLRCSYISHHTLITNGHFSTLSMSALDRLRSNQNAAARLLTSSNRPSHITPPPLKSLHWLLVAYRIPFKILTLTYRSLHGHAPFVYTFVKHFVTCACEKHDINTFYLVTNLHPAVMKHDKSFIWHVFSNFVNANPFFFVLHQLAREMFCTVNLC